MAEELQAGRAFVDLIPKLDKGALAAANAQMGGAFSGLGGKGKAAGLALTAGLAAGVAGVGAVGLAVGKTLDSAFDTIRIGTGATGDALKGLEQSFRNVGGNVSNSLDETATAIADLNTRTGLTGPALEGLATQILTLSRVAGEDLGTTIEAQTRMFGDWGVAVEDQAATLDAMFRASQATGIGVNDLSTKLVQFGAPLRQMGFSLEESAGLLGKFEKEGVNAELVMGSLRIALGKFAKDGRDPAEALAWVTEEIQNAGSAGEANALALEVFGARAGADMAAAIREGRFELGDLLTTLENGEETILGVAGETDDFGEKFSKLKNRVTLALEPLGVLTFDVLNKLADFLLPVISGIGERLPGALERMRAALEPVFGVAKQVFGILFSADFTGGPLAEDSKIVDVLFRIREGLEKTFGIAKQVFGILFEGDFEGGPLAEDSPFVDGLFRARELLERVFGFIRDNAKPILAGLAVAFALVTAPVTTVVAALVLAYTRFEGFRNVVDAVVRFLVTTVVPAVTTFAAYVAEQFGNLVAWVREHWTEIQEAISIVVDRIVSLVETGVGVVLWIWNNFGDTIVRYLEAVWENLRAIVEFGIDLIRGVIELVLAVIRGDWSAAWDAVTGILGDAWELVKTLVGNALGVVQTLLSDGLDVVLGLVGTSLDGVVGFFRDLPGRLARAAGDVFGFLWEAFRDAVNLIIRGWNALEFRIPGFDPPGPGPKFGGFTLGMPDIPELADGGRSIREGLAIVGDDGPELAAMSRGATVVPLDVAAMIAEAAGGARGGALIGHLEVDATGTDVTAADVVDRIFEVAAWTKNVHTRNDGRR